MPLYRAEVPLLAAVPAQLRQSDLVMLGNRHQRQGAPALSATDGRTAWARAVSSDIDIRQQGTVSPRSEGRVHGLQAGTDLLSGAGWRAGLYVGQLEGDAGVEGFARGIVGPVGRTDLRSQYLGLYGSWQSDSGLYADAVLQHAGHRYSVRTREGAAIQGKGRGWAASLEVGQAFALGGGWQIEPQLQLIHQRLDLDDTLLTGLTTVRQRTDSGWTVRAGAKVQGEWQTGAGSLKPYARVNLYKRQGGTDTATFIAPAAATDILTRTGGSSAELALGATWQWGPRWGVYGELGKAWATGGSQRSGSGVQGSLGLKARW